MIGDGLVRPGACGGQCMHPCGGRGLGSGSWGPMHFALWNALSCIRSAHRLPMTLPSTSSRVPLEQHGVPLLYPRYNSLEALQQVRRGDRGCIGCMESGASWCFRECKFPAGDAMARRRRPGGGGCRTRGRDDKKTGQQERQWHGAPCPFPLGGWPLKRALMLPCMHACMHAHACCSSQGAANAKANATTANAMAETARKLLSERKRKATGDAAGGIPGMEGDAAAEAPGPSSEAVGLDRPLTKLEIKRAKRAARRQNQPSEGTGEGAEEAAAAAGTQATATPAAAASAPKKHSGESNADEAQRIRAALGYVEADPAAEVDIPGPSAAAAAPAKKAKGAKGKKGAVAPAEAEGGEGREGPSCSQAPGGPVDPPAAAARPLPGGKFGFGFQLAQQQEEARAEEKIKGILLVDSAKDGYVPRRVGAHREQDREQG
jgi:hypothetical protein